MALLYPRQTGALRPIRRATDRNYMNANDKVYVDILALQSGSTTKDVDRQQNRFTALGSLTSGSRTGGTQLRGGSV
jgi:hypothetical protein